MSNYSSPAYNPKENVIRDALWLDDHFGRHNYGVMFAGDPAVYTPEQVRIPADVIFIPKSKE